MLMLLLGWLVGWGGGGHWYGGGGEGPQVYSMGRRHADGLRSCFWDGHLYIHIPFDACGHKDMPLLSFKASAMHVLCFNSFKIQACLYVSDDAMHT